MKLYFKQRFMTFLDSYDIYDEAGQTVYTVESELAWGRLMHVRGSSGNYLASLKRKMWTMLPTFLAYIGPNYAGTIKKEFTMMKPRYTVDYKGWRVEGNFMGFDYTVEDAAGQLVAVASKELFHLTDRYCIDVLNPDDALDVLLLVLAIDADKEASGT